MEILKELLTYLFLDSTGISCWLRQSDSLKRGRWPSATCEWGLTVQTINLIGERDTVFL